MCALLYLNRFLLKTAFAASLMTMAPPCWAVQLVNEFPSKVNWL